MFVVGTRAARRLSEWVEAGRILGETSRLTSRPSLLFLDVAETSDRELSSFAGGVGQADGEAVVVAGGRADLVRALVDEGDLPSAPRVHIGDTLSDPEWEALSRILQREGYGSNLTHEEHSERLRQARHLLPAIYEATDHRKPKV